MIRQLHMRLNRSVDSNKWTEDRFLTFDMADPRIKQLKIKTGVVKRIAKEKTSYEKEAEQEKKRAEKFASEGKDEHVIKKQNEVVQEALMMIPDTQRRLVKAYDELKSETSFVFFCFSLLLTSFVFRFSLLLTC